MPAVRILKTISPLLLLPLLIGAAPSPSSSSIETVRDLFQARIRALAASHQPAGSPLLAPDPPGITGVQSSLGEAASSSRPSAHPDAGSFARLVRQSFDPRDPETFMEPTRRFLEARGDLPRSHQTESESADDAGEEDSPDPVQTGVTIYPKPGGDLTGDGLEDILIDEFDPSDGFNAVSAMRGTDGEELWRVDVPSHDWGFTELVGDMSGDGKDDVLTMTVKIIEQNETSDCSETTCIYDYSDKASLYVELLSGASGKALIDKEYESSIDFHSVDSFTSDGVSGTYAYEEHLRSNNRYVIPLASGDHDGDGSRDLIINAIDIDWDTTYSASTTGIPSEELWVAGSEELQIADRIATQASILSGKDGGRVSLVTTPRAPSVSVLEPHQNVSGDPASELRFSTWGVPDYSVSCEWVGVVVQCNESTADPWFSLEILDGSTLEDVWAKSLSSVLDASVAAVDYDSTDDGVDDIVIWSVSWNASGEELRFVLEALDGRSGAPIWTREGTEDQYPVAAGEYGGSPGEDLVAIAIRYDESPDPLGEDPFAPGESQWVLVRIDGSNGQNLMETSRPIYWTSDSFDVVIPVPYADGMSDADGDGQEDVYTGAYLLGFNEGAEPGTYEFAGAESDYSFESGANGSVLAAAQGSGLFVAYPEPDLDGDGGADMSEWRYPIADDEGLRVAFQSMGPATPLWQREIPAAAVFETTIYPSEDQDGVPGGEVLYGFNLEDGDGYLSTIASLTGATGHERWRKQR